LLLNIFITQQILRYKTGTIWTRAQCPKHNKCTT